MKQIEINGWATEFIPGVEYKCIDTFFKDMYTFTGEFLRYEFKHDKMVKLAVFQELHKDQPTYIDMCFLTDNHWHWTIQMISEVVPVGGTNYMVSNKHTESFPRFAKRGDFCIEQCSFHQDGKTSEIGFYAWLPGAIDRMITSFTVAVFKVKMKPAFFSASSN